MQHQTAGKENYHGNKNKQRKNITETHQQVIKPTQNTECFLGTRQTVHNHFETAEQNNHKAPENNGVNRPDERPPENLCLKTGHFDGNPQPLSEMFQRLLFGKFEKLKITPNAV